MLPRLSRTPCFGQRVIVRVDLNVPIVGGRVGDDFRIRAALPTIRRLLRGGNSIILLSHASDPRQTLAPVARCLSRLLKRNVAFIRSPRATGRRLPKIALLENLRFWPGEARSSEQFARTLARLGDIVVNDAFGVAHRRGASLTILPRLRPALLGLRFEEELRVLDESLTHPRRPLVAVLGGAKVGTKMSLLRRFNRFADRVLVGGGVANTLLRARGMTIGCSLASKPTSAIRAIARSRKVTLPVDGIVVRAGRGVRPRIASVGEVGRDEAILDIGPRTRRQFLEALRGMKTVIWNGPLGRAEEESYADGTAMFARALARMNVRTIIGGGDTLAFLHRHRITSRFWYRSTGGGAMLAYLAGERLPALEALKRKAGKIATGTNGATVQT